MHPTSLFLFSLVPFALALPTDITLDPRKALFTLSCGPSDAAFCTVGQAQACVNYLNSIGGNKCTANSDTPISMCFSGPCNLYGQAVGVNSATSNCADVARGAQQIINACQANGQVRGNNAANGNGNLILQFRAN